MAFPSLKKPPQIVDTMPIATPQGTLDFKSVDTVTFVGASSNTVIDTTTGSLGVGVDGNGPTSNLHVVGNTRLEGDINMLHTSNTAAIKLNSNVVTEFPRSKKLIKYPRVALTSAAGESSGYQGYYVTESSNSTNTNRHSWKAFDMTFATDTSDNGWANGIDDYSGSGNTYQGSSNLGTGAVDGEWIKLQLPHKIRLEYMKIWLKDNDPTRIPDSWILYGSDDNTNWTELLSKTGQGAVHENTYNVNANSMYNYLGVVVTKIYGQPNYFRIMELEYYGVPEYDPDAHGVDVVVKSVPNVPNTDWLEVYYDAKDLADGSTTVNDLKPVGTAINGTVAGNTSVTDGAFTFDGSGDYISGTLSSSATGDWVHSLSMWFKADSFSATKPHTLFYGGGTSISANNLIFLRVDGGDNPHIHYSDIGTAVQKNMSVFTDVWYHVTATYSGGGWANAKLYINGELTNDTLTDTTPLTLTGSSTFYIGKAINSFNPSFNGSIANFRLFNRALTSDEIYQLYAYQKEYFGHGDLSMTLKAGRLGIGTSEPKAALDVRGDIYGGCPIFFTAYAGANNTVTGSSTGTVIVFNKTTVNKGGAYDTSNGRCTFPVSGYYEVFFRGGTAGTADFHAKIYKNGNAPGSGGWPDNLPRLWDNGDTQYRNAGTIQFFYYFTAGEYIEVRLTDSSVFNADNYNSFSVKYLSN